jgi:hypothetical protein
MKKSAFLIFMMAFLCLNAQESIYDILPDSACPGIELYGEQYLYVGDDLFNLINGGAELYHEFGFVEVLAAEVVLPGADPLKVEIYDMGSPEAAWGIFSLTATSNAIPFYAGVAGRKGEGFAQFIKGNYMIYIYFEDIEETELQLLAGCLSEKIKASYPPPLLMKTVDVSREKAEKVIYFRGNLGLSSIYSFHYKDVFGYKEGAAAIYPDLTIFLLQYENEGECIDHYNAAKDFIINSTKYHDPKLMLRGSFHVKDRKEQQIDCYFENTFLVLFLYPGEMDVSEMRREIVSSRQ